MTTCVISQPRFFPGLHYLHRMMLADVFVIFDTVQFSPRHEENRTKLKSPNGPQWLTVPMCKSSRKQLILDTNINNGHSWRRKSVKTLEHLYHKSPYYSTYSAEINRILETSFKSLVQLNRRSWEPALRLLNIECKYICASECPIQGHGPELLVKICKYVGADIYLSGAYGREYIDAEAFAAEGIKLRFHEYEYPVYRQRFSGFVPFLSYLDMLFNTGLQREEVLAGGSMVTG